MSGIRDRLGKRIWVVLGIVLLFLVPDILPYVPQIRLDVVMLGMYFGLAAVGLNLLLRHTKLVSFGHAAFFGTGAYTVALLSTPSRYEGRLLGSPEIDSLFVLLFGALVAAALVAAVIGALSLRHTGLYFSLITLAFGALLFEIVNGQSRLLGGSDGLVVRPGEHGRALLPGMEEGSVLLEHWELFMYYFSAVLLVVMLYVMYRIVNSPFGTALDAIGQDRTRAEFIGLPVKRYVWVAFVISGIYGGLAGGMYAVMQRHIRPEATLDVFVSGDILFMAILGGFQTLVGPLVGGVVLEGLLFWGEGIVGDFDQLLVGVLLLVIVFGFPEGLVGSVERGGTLRTGFTRLRRDPSLVGTWVGSAVSGSIGALKRSFASLKVIIFGVK